jgi:ClpP class serine protease
MFHQHAMLTAEGFRASREGKDVCGDKVELEQMTFDKRLAIIPVKGPLGIELGAFEKGAGATDYQDIMDDLAKAEANLEVDNILLNMDTPGGMWGGLLETSQAIARASKPVYVYSPPGGTIASAGMFLAAAAKGGRFLAPSAQAGSIGVYCAYTDMSELAAKRGVRVRVFSSGVYKGMGIPGTALSAEQEELLQAEVMSLADEFYNHIHATLGDVPAEAMQGQMFRSEQAVKIGLADAVISSLEEVKSFLR